MSASGKNGRGAQAALVVEGSEAARAEDHRDLGTKPNFDQGTKRWPPIKATFLPSKEEEIETVEAGSQAEEEATVSTASRAREAETV